MENKIKGFLSLKTVRGKILFYFMLVIFLMSMISIYTFLNSGKLLNHIDEMFRSSVILANLSNNIQEADEYLEKYLVTKNNEDLKMFKAKTNELRRKIARIDRRPSNDTVSIKWKNVAYLIEEYINFADNAIKAKKERKIVMYYSNYGEAEKIRIYINEEIDVLRSTYVDNNTKLYINIEDKLKNLQTINLSIICFVIFISLFIVVWSSNAVTKPIKILANKANEMYKGNFDIEDIELKSEDEVEEMARAFNNMKNSIVRYIEEIQEKSQIEIKLSEQEMQNLKMKNLVKNARLETLQSQMNPHFLFNTINACIQMAQAENAERTADFLYNMGKLFRYNLKNLNNMVSIKDEIENVDAYIYLLKIRYEDILVFEKSIEYDNLDARMPLLILQPIIENAFFHGISAKESGGVVKLSVAKKEDYIELCVEDNGCGISSGKIEKILSQDTGNISEDEPVSKGNGIGLRNVIQRLRLFYEQDVLSIESELGQWTRFTIKIPLKKVDF